MKGSVIRPPVRRVGKWLVLHCPYCEAAWDVRPDGLACSCFECRDMEKPHFYLSAYDGFWDCAYCFTKIPMPCTMEV